MIIFLSYYSNMFPKYDDDQLSFIMFVQDQTNRDIFDDLFKGELYGMDGSSRGRQVKKAQDGYEFIRNLDDADIATIIFEEDSDYPPRELRNNIAEFEKWLAKESTKRGFHKHYNHRLHADIVQKWSDIESRKRVTGRTSEIKDELLDIYYVPHNKKGSVKGKRYRESKKSFYSQARQKKGGRKTKRRKR